MFDLPTFTDLTNWGIVLLTSGLSLLSNIVLTVVSGWISFIFTVLIAAGIGFYLERRSKMGFLLFSTSSQQVEELYRKLIELHTKNADIEKWGLQFGLKLQQKDYDNEELQSIFKDCIDSAKAFKGVTEDYYKGSIGLNEDQYNLALEMIMLSRDLYGRADDLLRQYKRPFDNYTLSSIRTFQDTVSKVSKDFELRLKYLRKSYLVMYGKGTK